MGNTICVAGLMLGVAAACATKTRVAAPTCQQVAAHLTELKRAALAGNSTCTALAFSASTRTCLVCADSERAADECLAAAQSFEDAMRVVCESPTASKANTIENPAEAAATLAEYVEGRIANPRVVEFWEQVALADPNERLMMLERWVQEAGLTQCEFLHFTRRQRP